MKYKIQKDIDQIRLELARVASIREMTQAPGWKHVGEIFQRHIGRFVQDVLDLCKDPKKNELEIRCKKMLADSLADILYQVDTRVKSEPFLYQQLNDKSAKLADLADKQRLSQM